jgi:tRNA-Thr(GGU) m(6)t(6)A37 methyltransferase TsaA
MELIRQLVGIGVIHSPFTQIAGMPIQPIYAEGIEGFVEIFPEFEEGISDLNGFERIWLIYIFDRATSPKLKVIPFRDKAERGVFATRAPSRPNPLGISVVRLKGIEGRTLKVGNVDILDGTPLVDIKPYIPDIDSYPDSRAGWFDSKTIDRKDADERFR